MRDIYFWKEYQAKYAQYWCCNNLIDSISKENIKNFNECYKFLNQFENPLLLEKWNPPKLCFVQIDKRIKYKIGDSHTTLQGFSYLISQNMIDKIGDVLEKYGVLLPLEVEGREDKLYRYWVTNELECMDKEKSLTTKNFANDNFVINKLVVDEDKFDGSMIFRVKDKNYTYNQYFVTNEFIELLRYHKLKGFEFYRCGRLTRRYYGDAYPECPDKPILLG